MTDRALSHVAFQFTIYTSFLRPRQVLFTHILICLNNPRLFKKDHSVDVLSMPLNIVISDKDYGEMNNGCLD